MSELLSVALRMMTPRYLTGKADVTPESEPLPTLLPYAEYVRRFDPEADLPATRHATAVAHLVRIHRTLDALNGLARHFGAHAALPDSDHLYQAHGEPRD